MQEKRRNIPLPPVLYNYCAFNHKYTPAIFERNEVYFQSADKLNDPFDMKIFAIVKGTQAEMISWLESGRDHNRVGSTPEKIHAWASDRVKRARGLVKSALLRTHEENDQLERKRTGVFCMTAIRDNILMWTHYADKHQGFCLGLATKNTFFGRACPIGYSRYAPCVNLIDPASRRIPTLGKALFTKAKDWEYEAEWRIVCSNTLGLQTFPHEALTEVILGCRMTGNNRRQIMEWCRQRKTPPSLYEARPKKRAFGLDIVPLTY